MSINFESYDLYINTIEKSKFNRENIYKKFYFDIKQFISDLNLDSESEINKCLTCIEKLSDIKKKKKS